MIIRYPTGLYNLSNSIDNLSNITWYISNEDPPRSLNVTIKIPPSEEVRKASSIVIERKTRRKSYGDLVYSINEANNSTTNSGQKQYGDGDILDFPENTTDNVLNIPKNKRFEHRHDLNELDMESIGFNESDINKFNSDIYDKKQELEEEFVLVRQQIENIEIDLKNIQKKINESNKALNAVKILGDEELENKIATKKSGYEDEVEILTNQHNLKTQELNDISNNLTNIDMVAK